MSPILPCICQNRKKEQSTYQHSQGHYRKDESAKSVMGYVVLAVSSRMDWLETCKSTGRMLLTKLPFADELKLHHVSYQKQSAEQTDQHPEHVSDPVTEESVFQSPHLLSEHREDFQCGPCCAGIPKHPIICRSTSLRKAKYFCYQANTEHLLDIPNRQWFIKLQA